MIRQIILANDLELNCKNIISLKAIENTSYSQKVKMVNLRNENKELNIILRNLISDELILQRKMLTDLQENMCKQFENSLLVIFTGKKERFEKLIRDFVKNQIRITDNVNNSKILDLFNLNIEILFLENILTNELKKKSQSFINLYISPPANKEFCLMETLNKIKEDSLTFTAQIEKDYLILVETLKKNVDGVPMNSESFMINKYGEVKSKLFENFENDVYMLKKKILNLRRVSTTNID